MANLKPIVVKTELMWDDREIINPQSKKYQINLTHLSDDAVKKLTEIGVKVRNDKHDPEQGNYIVVKSANYPIKAGRIVVTEYAEYTGPSMDNPL